MNKKSIVIRVSIVILVLSFVSFSLNAQSNQPEGRNNAGRQKSITLSSLSQSNPIEILQNDDFIINDFPGIGTFEDPFLITNLKIESADVPLISISGTDKYFKIANNLLEGTSITSAGIRIINVQNGLIERNEFQGMNTGIEFVNSSRFLISKNVISKVQINGIEIVNGVQNTISQNKIELGRNGIQIIASSSNTIVNNQFSNNEYLGLDIDAASAENTIIWNNFVSNSKISITQAMDNGQNNFFSSNYWNDLEGPDTDKNGVIDIPYEILGLANNLDLLPVAKLYNIEKPGIVDNDINNFNVIFALTLVLALLVVGGLFVQRIILRIRRIHLEQLTQDVTTEMIGYASTSLISLINSSEDPSFNEVDTVPQELLNYKFILNPVRLAILKIMFESQKIPSFRVRETLGVSWGSFGKHVELLVSKGFIFSQEEFVDGTPRQVLILEPEGSSIYLELQKLFRKLFNIS